jgi:predicted metal-dependent HD superfamily phosphohydrolase
MTKDRWEVLMNSLGLSAETGCYEALYQAYSESHRFYHTVAHVQAMLDHLDGITAQAERPAELELAIWFHDAIYKPLSKANEKDSAQWASTFLAGCGYDEAGIARIGKLIMATLHTGAVNTCDEKLIVDIDLTILGTPPAVYDAFERNVRREYKVVPWFIYRRKRKALLAGFLDCPYIYRTDTFRDRYERTARANILRAIAAL